LEKGTTWVFIGTGEGASMRPQLSKFGAIKIIPSPLYNLHETMTLSQIYPLHNFIGSRICFDVPYIFQDNDQSCEFQKKKEKEKKKRRKPTTAM
jgi:hypothetical protein